MSAWRCWGALAAALAAGPVLGGCSATSGGPERLYSVSEEVSWARNLLDGGGDSLVARYYAVDPNSVSADAERTYLRNEIVARRMYIIDVQYSAYEAELTSDRQKFGFASEVVQQGLNTAGALVTPAATTRILSGLAGAVGAVKGFYDSEIVIAKTIQIAQAQMRALRDKVATRILERRTESSITYPLSAALHDLEDYYRAGTLTAGLIKAAGDAGEAAKEAAAVKNAATYVGTYGPDSSSAILDNYIAPGGRLNAARARTLDALLVELGHNRDVRTIIDSVEAAPLRRQLIEYARRRGINL